MKTMKAILLLIVAPLGLVAYGIIWVAVGDLAPLWLRIIFTVSIWSGLILIIVSIFAEKDSKC